MDGEMTTEIQQLPGFVADSPLEEDGFEPVVPPP
jgi:hypothetical protein